MTDVTEQPAKHTITESQAQARRLNGQLHSTGPKDARGETSKLGQRRHPRRLRRRPPRNPTRRPNGRPRTI
jgi:hypothetical protein